MLCIADVVEYLRDHGITKGDSIVFEAPDINSEELQNGFESLFNGLIELVGEAGTLIVPTCTPLEGYPKPTFDPALSASEIGPFSEFFRLQPGVMRSHSPTHSLAVWGNAAASLTACHRNAHSRPTPWGDGPFGRGSPWDLLYDRNAWWVLLGSGLAQSPLTDYIRALYAEQHTGITRQTPYPHFNATLLDDWLRESGLSRVARIGEFSITMFRVQPVIDSALQALNVRLEQFEPSIEVQQWLEKVRHVRETGYLQAGVAKVNITPPVPCQRWEGKLLSGVARDLFARVIVLAHNGYKVVLVLCDLLGISREQVCRIREEVFRLTGIPSESVLVASTHAHSTPDTIGAGYESPAYLDNLVGTVAEGVHLAYTRLQSARLGWSRVPLRGLAQSRRKKLVDGSVYTTRYGVPSTWRVSPELIAGEGQIDPDLTVIRIEDLEGRLLAAISNFGCHASVALMSNQISGDFPGEAMALLEQVYGEHVVALCTNGAAADVDPTLEMPYWGPRNDAMARRLGRIFAAQVMECLERVEVDDIACLHSIQQPITLGVRQDWFQLLERDPERMQQEFNQGWKISAVVNRALHERVIHTEVQALRLNDLILVGFPGEIFAETGLKLKDSIPARAVIALELANDDIGYIPPQEAFSEGGYEVAQNLWGRVEPGAAELLLETAQRVVEQLAGRVSSSVQERP